MPTLYQLQCLKTVIAQLYIMLWHIHKRAPFLTKFWQKLATRSYIATIGGLPVRGPRQG